MVVLAAGAKLAKRTRRGVAGLIRRDWQDQVRFFDNIGVAHSVGFPVRKELFLKDVLDAHGQPCLLLLYANRSVKLSHAPRL